jgi:hypothetical protein
MPEFLNSLPEIINKICDIFELILVRLTLLILLAVGAYTLIRGHL